MDFLHARKVSPLNLRFKPAQFPRYPNFASLNTYGNPPNPQKVSSHPHPKTSGLCLAKANHSPHQRGWDCLDLFALNVSTDFLFRNFVSSKEKSSALCSQVARTRKSASHPCPQNETGIDFLPIPVPFGEGGIRTRGRVTPTTTFEVVTLNRSDTSPFLT